MELDGNLLLKLSRAALENHFGVKNHNLESLTDESMQAATGAFVSLYNKSELRGCIGHLESDLPLAKEIPYLSVESALSDHRFNPVTANELEELTIELSILTVPEELNGKTAEEKTLQILPGIHGVILQQGVRKATFLPQVWDSLPGINDFLTQLSMKAGLPATAWKDDETEFSVYEVKSFKE